MDEFRAVFDAAPDGILVVDTDGTIRSANPIVEKLFGWRIEELVGRDVEVLVPSSERELHVRHRERYTDSPKTRPMGVGLDLRARRRDGTELPVEISLSPWHSSEGLRIIVAIRDVTQRKTLKDFSTGALRATEEERQRIARELHDDTAQHLAALMVRLRVIERHLDDDELSDDFGAFRDELAACAEGVRRIARGLRPPELEDAGVIAALRAHARAVQEGTGLTVELDVEEVDDLLTGEARLVLYRIIQEAVSNTLRHSGADLVNVRVYHEDGRVVGEVRDRGKGFAPEEAHVRGAGLGLMGMRERAAMSGGHLTVQSEPDKGTTVRVELPSSKQEVT